MLAIRTQEDIDNPEVRVYLFRVPIYDRFRNKRVLMEMVFHNLPSSIEDVGVQYAQRAERAKNSRELSYVEEHTNEQVLDSLEALSSYIGDVDWPESTDFHYQTEKTFKFPHPNLGWETATLQEIVPVDAMQ